MPSTRIETVYYYELPAGVPVKPAGREPAPLPSLQRVARPLPALNRMLYAAVGARWWWVDRLEWSAQQWREVLMQTGYETWVAYLDGAPCGYFELRHAGEVWRWDVPPIEPAAAHFAKQALPSAAPWVPTEIEYFGVLEEFHGCGIGAWLLERAVLRARERGSERVLVHTSSFDHPMARANYEARGFVLRNQFSAAKSLPDLPRDEFGREPASDGP